MLNGVLPAIGALMLVTSVPTDTVTYVPKPIPTAQDRTQIECLARNVYHEAGNQSTTGKIAVTNVVMNRVDDKRFPKTPCTVIHQKRRGVCQFSWVCSKTYIRDHKLFQEAKRVAEMVYWKQTPDVTGGARFYHATYVRPSWSYVFQRTTRIGAHIFYRG